MAIPVTLNNETAKILLVDDKQENLLAVEAVLESEGYDFIRAESAKEALKILLKDQDFSLILLDVNMPEINGFETAEMIYKRERLQHIPIIFITAYDTDEHNFFSGYKSGGIDYICKPINPELLRLKVQIFIELFRKNRELYLKEKELKSLNKELQSQIKEKEKIANELRFRNIQLSDAQKLTLIGSWEWDVLTDIVSGSEEIYDIFEIDKNLESFSSRELLGKIHPSDENYVRSAIVESISENKPFDLYFRISGSGGTKFINKKGRTVTNSSKDVIKIYGTSQDITELKKTKEQLKIFSLFERMLSEIYIFNEDDLKLVFANAEALRNLSLSSAELKNLAFPALLSETDEKSLRRKIKLLSAGKEDKVVLFDNIKREDNSSYPVEMHIQLIDQGQQWEELPAFSSRVCLAVVLDLTERKRTEHRLLTSLKEKETLLKEIHHRVKNNLQIISSLLNLQKNTDLDSQAINVINECITRVRAMSILHEKLYRSKDFGGIDIVSYIKELGEYLIKTYSSINMNIDLSIIGDSNQVNMDTGISLGLILNELISNSIKHAFRGRKEGIITIEFHNVDGDQYCLKVRDDGRGFPDDFDIEKVQSLGMLLVNSLVHQLRGDLIIHNNHGAEFEILFSKR
ncbi:MAG TPA: histidine kinase dimerization/phosphoacceptor domain -containing protein [Ignavibacteriaceae bacterium]|nr:histidine kinase dimerization/phosphoacceptor domain -containing protein [Ignavibacteriaceae bacterium]